MKNNVLIEFSNGRISLYECLGLLPFEGYEIENEIVWNIKEAYHDEFGNVIFIKTIKKPIWYSLKSLKYYLLKFF